MVGSVLQSHSCLQTGKCFSKPDLIEELVLSSNLLLMVVEIGKDSRDLFRGVELGDLDMTFLVVMFSSSLSTISVFTAVVSFLISTSKDCLEFLKPVY